MSWLGRILIAICCLWLIGVNGTGFTAKGMELLGAHGRISGHSALYYFLAAAANALVGLFGLYWSVRSVKRDAIRRFSPKGGIRPGEQDSGGRVK